MTVKEQIPGIGTKCLVRASYPHDKNAVGSAYLGDISIDGEKKHLFASDEENRRYMLMNDQHMVYLDGVYTHALIASEQATWETQETLERRFDSSVASKLIEMIKVPGVAK